MTVMERVFIFRLKPLRAYEFQTVWHVKAPKETVWQEIYHSENWPLWWKGVKKVVELRKGDDSGVGSIRHYTWKSRLPYLLSFEMQTVRVQPPSILEGVAAGELSGWGRWELAGNGDQTIVKYDWHVKTTRKWMNIMAPIARPLFKWNHDVVMSWGARGLAARLGVRVVEQRVDGAEASADQETFE